MASAVKQAAGPDAVALHAIGDDIAERRDRPGKSLEGSGVGNRSGQTGAALRVLRAMTDKADEDGFVSIRPMRLAGLTRVRSSFVGVVLDRLRTAKEIEIVCKPGHGISIYRLTPWRAERPEWRQRSATTRAAIGRSLPPIGRREPEPRRRRRKPKAQFVLFRNVCTTAVLVPRETNALAARFQDVLRRLEPALSTRPNVASTAGWLLREGFRFASRNRVHGLARATAVPADDCVHLHVHVDRETWAEIHRWVVAENTPLGTVVPRLIELGAEVTYIPDLSGLQVTP